MKRPRNVLLISATYPPDIGGISTYSRQLAMAYARGGTEVMVIAASSGPRGSTQEGPVSVCNVGKGKQLAVFWRILFCAIRCLRSGNYDLIHATTWRVAVVAVILGLGAKTVLTVHGRESFAIGRLFRRLFRFCLNRVGSVIVVSQPILDQLRQDLNIPISHASVSWNGITFLSEAQSHVPSAPFSKIFFMGRLVERKNLPNAVRAVSLLRDAGLDVHFFIAGAGHDLSSIERERLRLRLEDSITLLGMIADEEAIRYYQECGVFLHPQIATLGGNDIEGFGLSIADAMSFGCVPVAGRAGGPSDFIRDGETGFLVDGEDTVAIAEAVRSILAQPSKGREMSRKAQLYALEHFSWDAHVRDILTSVNQEAQSS